MPVGRFLPLVTLLLTGAFLLASCDDDDSDSGSDGLTFDYLVGTWRTGEPAFVQFAGDGTYRIAFTQEGLDNSPVERGEFTLDGTLFTFISDDESRNCEPGQRGSYEIEVDGEDRMRQFKVEDECLIRGGDPIPVTLERIAP